MAGRDLTDALHSISVPSAETQRDEKKPFTVYRIEVQGERSRWIVFRRYSQFAILNKLLQRQFPQERFPFPPKKLLGNLDERFVEKRRIALQFYVIDLLSKRGINDNAEFRSFLDPSIEYGVAVNEVGVDAKPDLAFWRHVFGSNSETFGLKELLAVSQQAESTQAIGCEEFLVLCRDELHFGSDYKAYLMFNVLDQDSDGLVVLRDAACGLSLLTAAKGQDKLAFAFKLYQQEDKKGFISRKNVFALVMAWGSVVSALLDVNVSDMAVQFVDDIEKDQGFDSADNVSMQKFCIVAVRNQDVARAISRPQ